MQSTIIAMLEPPDRRGAALLVRRADGQFVLERIDVRLAAASRIAAGLRTARGFADGRDFPDVSVA